MKTCQKEMIISGRSYELRTTHHSNIPLTGSWRLMSAPRRRKVPQGESRSVSRIVQTIRTASDRWLPDGSGTTDLSSFPTTSRTRLRPRRQLLPCYDAYHGLDAIIWQCHMFTATREHLPSWIATHRTRCPRLHKRWPLLSAAQSLATALKWGYSLPYPVKDWSSESDIPRFSQIHRS